MSENRVIGRGGELPWRLSADLRRFKRLTMGHTIVMGRKTFESIGRKLLPGRTSIVVTRQANFDSRGALIARDLDDAMRLAASDDEVFIIGGAEIYRQALPRAQQLYLTLVHANFEGDTLFPELQQDQWRLVESERHAADEKNEYDFSFQILERPL